MPSAVSIVVENEYVKAAKDALASRNLLDRTRKIRAKSLSVCIIPTTISGSGRNAEELRRGTKTMLEKQLGLCESSDRISCVVEEIRPQTSGIRRGRNKNDILASMIEEWLDRLPMETLGSNALSKAELRENCPEIYDTYPPMLVLAKDAFGSGAWRVLCRETPPTALKDLYRGIVDAFGCTHLAINGSISPHEASYPLTGDSTNVLRSPNHFRSLYGEFGDLVSRSPSRSDLENAFWVQVKQNGIYQSWAPLYTMFSRGNVAEKQRLVDLLRRDSHEISPSESSAVDLYAGIGYFSFSYARAGFKKVLCWELNPWSVEGLRRGAAMNRWSVRSMDGNTVAQEPWEKLFVFEENNEHALRRIEASRQLIPPVRHVNCGLLPSSAAVWKDAVDMLDPILGGWIHVHENIAEHEMRRKVEEICRLFRNNAVGRRVDCRHLQRVKSYAPGVMHCVMDIHISPA